jgi:predicted  nucleic acid-binding Zn-ribbon protein
MLSASIGRTLSVGLAVVFLATACKSEPPKPPAEPPPAPEPDVSAAPEAAVQSLSELAVEYEKLEQQQVQNNRQISALLQKYQKRGGSLPPGFGAEMTDEQRALLAERIKTERAGLRTLLQDLLDRDKEVQQLKTRLDQVSQQLPASVVVGEGDRHDRIAMNYLIRQGVNAKKAYDIVSQVNLQDALVPGFRVWTYYQKGQFGTWVTRGKATITPQEHQKRLTDLLQEERDEALKQLALTQSERDELKSTTQKLDETVARTSEELKAMTETAEKERAEVARREADANSVRYILGSKKDLVNRKIVEKNLRRFYPDVGQTQTVNLTETSEIPIDAKALGLRRVKKVTLLPESYKAGVDYMVSTGGPTAVLRFTAADKFKASKLVIVVED